MGTSGSVVRLKVLYSELADLTQPKCGACTKPFSCCRPIHCRTTKQWARAQWGAHLPDTGHPDLPLLGPYGCTAPPYMRPHCSSAVCDEHLSDGPFVEELHRLRDEIAEEETKFEGAFE